MAHAYWKFFECNRDDVRNVEIEEQDPLYIESVDIMINEVAKLYTRITTHPSRSKGIETTLGD
jgi:hypothetical protein